MKYIGESLCWFTAVVILTTSIEIATVLDVVDMICLRFRMGIWFGLD